MIETLNELLKLRWLDVTSPPITGLLVAFLVLSVCRRAAWGLYVLLFVLTVIPAGVDVEGVVIPILSAYSFNLLPVDLVLVAYSFLWVFYHLTARKGINIKAASPLLPILIVVFVRYLSTLATLDLVGRSSIAFLRYIEWLLVFLIVVDLARGKDALNLLRLFLWIIAIQSVITIVQTTLSLSAGDLYVSRGGTLSSQGSILSWLQIYAILMGLSFAYDARSLLVRTGWGAYTGLVGIGLASTLGRSAWITTGLGIVIYYLLDIRTSLLQKVSRTVQSMIIVGLMAGIYLSLNVLNLGVIVERAATFDNLDAEGSWLQRVVLWRVGLEVFLQHPLLGVGTGNYSQLVLGYFTSSDFLTLESHGIEGGVTAHNAVVNVLSETGLLGFMAYLFFAGRVTVMIITDLRRFKQSNWYPFLLPLGSAIIAQLLADWYSWTSFVVWSMLFLALYVVLRREALNGAAKAPVKGRVTLRRGAVPNLC